MSRVITPGYRAQNGPVNIWFIHFTITPLEPNISEGNALALDGLAAKYENVYLISFN